MRLNEAMLPDSIDTSKPGIYHIQNVYDGRGWSKKFLGHRAVHGPMTPAEAQRYRHRKGASGYTIRYYGSNQNDELLHHDGNGGWRNTHYETSEPLRRTFPPGDRRPQSEETEMRLNEATKIPAAPGDPEGLRKHLEKHFGMHENDRDDTNVSYHTGPAGSLDRVRRHLKASGWHHNYDTWGSKAHEYEHPDTGTRVEVDKHWFDEVRVHGAPRHEETEMNEAMDIGRIGKRSLKTGFMDNHPWKGAKVKHHSGKTGTVRYVSREPTFSQMVPYRTVLGVNWDDGSRDEVHKDTVRKLKEERDPRVADAVAAMLDGNSARFASTIGDVLIDRARAVVRQE